MANTRIVCWFSCGAASAVATKMALAKYGPYRTHIVYCETGSEHEDNKRFMHDCEVWFDHGITMIKSNKYVDTWDVWEKRKYISGIAGAPCTTELKVNPRLEFQRDGDINIFGYTNDSSDISRAQRMRNNYPELTIETPLIDRMLDKSACLGLLINSGIEPPITYEMGFPNANCIPCCKAQSPNYWSLVRDKAPEQFARMVEISRRLGVRLAKINNVRIFIDEIPIDWPVTEAVAPSCDFLCHLIQQDIEIEEGMK